MNLATDPTDREASRGLRRGGLAFRVPVLAAVLTAAGLGLAGGGPGAVRAAVASTAQDPAVQAKLEQPRPIAAGEYVWTEELTYLEIRDRIAAGATTAIVPTGGIEENGPFLSTGKHNVILQGLCPAIARELGNALCAPIVKFVPEGQIDPPTRAMRYPGSISVRDATYEALLTDIVASLRQAGFRNIILIGDSGGNQTGMGKVADALNARWQGESEGDGARVHFVREFYDPGWAATERYTAEELGVTQTRDDGHHDDIWVTAMMAVTDPGQIRFDERVEADLASINGVDLKPLEKTVRLGQRMIEFRARLTADAIRRSIAGVTDGRGG
jgi:creatinine amidohydrolase/Fe(II)-dependent formamide hydrolase-like protein